MAKIKIPNMDRLRQGGLIKGDTLRRAPLTLTVKNVSTTNFNQPNGQKEKKPTLTFNECEDKLALNKFNVTAMYLITRSDETDDWIGTKIDVYFDPDVFYNEEQVGGVRICKSGDMPDHVLEYYESVEARFAEAGAKAQTQVEDEEAE